MTLEEQFHAMSLDDLRRFVEDGQEEHLHLDFKRVEKAAMTAQDRRTLARALSGFANADGGLVVWGIDARKEGADSPDVARGLCPISDVATLLSRLNQLTPEVVNPIVPGVLHRALLKPDGDGFAVSLVPASQGGPHMAKGREDRYYVRSGDSFRLMEHFQIADMFGHRQRPSLELGWRVHLTGHSPAGHGQTLKGRVVVTLRNAGRATASAPYVRLCVRGASADGGLANPHGTSGFRKLATWGASGFEMLASGPQLQLHPSMEVDLTAVGVTFAARQPTHTDVVFEWEAGAQDAQPTQGTLVVPGAVIVDELGRARQ